MASIPCTAGSSWQRINLKRGGAKQKKRVEDLRNDMHVLLAHLRKLADHVRAGGGTISFEWPRHCSLWREPIVQQFIEEFHLKPVDFDGCALGLVSTTGKPLYKPWRILTDNQDVVDALSNRRMHTRPRARRHCRQRDP